MSVVMSAARGFRATRGATGGAVASWRAGASCVVEGAALLMSGGARAPTM